MKSLAGCATTAPHIRSRMKAKPFQARVRFTFFDFIEENLGARTHRTQVNINTAPDQLNQSLSLARNTRSAPPLKGPLRRTRQEERQGSGRTRPVRALASLALREGSPAPAV